MTHVTLLTLPHRSVGGRLAHIVARLAGEARDVGPFHGGDDVAGLVGRKLAFRNGLVGGHELGRQVLAASHGHIGGQGMPALVILRHFGLMAFLAHGRRRLLQHVAALVLDGAGVVGLDLVAIATGHFGGRHGAVPKFLDNARRSGAVAGDATVAAVGQRIHGPR